MAGDPVVPLLAAQHLVKRYPHRTAITRQVRGWVQAVDDVSLELRPGEAVGLVGESGCGKSTLARLLVGLIPPTSGEVRFRNRPLAALTRTERREFHRAVQMIFQSSQASLNPRLRVWESIAEPLQVHRLVKTHELRGRVGDLLTEVGLDSSLAERFPHALSGGQRQRVAIARALATRPALIVCDEPVASLDLSIQQQILQLLIQLQARHGIAYLFISHHLGVVSAIAHRVLVMYLGRLVEVGENPALFRDPRHPYTQGLLASVSGNTLPLASGLVASVSGGASHGLVLGEPGSSLHPPTGCRFHPRCPHAEPRCATDDPALAPRTGGRLVACHFA